MIINCLIAGVGGQGILTMSRIIRTAAFSRGLEVYGSDTIGTARLEGSELSHIRIGQGFHSPLVPRGKADIVIALEIAEAVRVHPFLSATGRMLVLDRLIIPASEGEPRIVDAALADHKTDLRRLDTPAADTGKSGKAKNNSEEMLAFLKAYLSHPSEERLAQKGGGDWFTVIDGGELIKKCGNSGLLNMALLGVAVKKNFFPFSAEDITAILRDKGASGDGELNIRAFNAGLEQ